MNQNVIISNAAEIEPNWVCGEWTSMLANADQADSYQVDVRDASEHL